MSAAFVIEVRGRQAGLVVRQRGGEFRFFAAVAEAFPLEGRVFRSAAHATKAVKTTLDAAAAPR